MLDLAGMALTKADVASLIAELSARDVRIMGVEGRRAANLGPGLPPLLKGGRPAGALVETPDGSDNAPTALPAAAAPKQPPFLLLDNPVRSGQSVIFPHGDVTVVGSVASGPRSSPAARFTSTARCAAAPSPAPPATRGRGSCRKSEAELLAIDGWYQDTADNMNENLYGRPIQAWLENDAIMVAALGSKHGVGGDKDGEGSGRDIRQGRGRQDDVHRRLGRGAGAGGPKRRRVVDFDVGLRNLDLVMGVERRVVYDLINVVQGVAKLPQALIRDKRIETLSILPASQTRDKDALTEDGVARVISELRENRLGDLRQSGRHRARRHARKRPRRANASTSTF